MHWPLLLLCGVGAVTMQPAKLMSGAFAVRRCVILWPVLVKGIKWTLRSIIEKGGGGGVGGCLFVV